MLANQLSPDRRRKLLDQLTRSGEGLPSHLTLINRCRVEVEGLSESGADDAADDEASFGIYL